MNSMKRGNTYPIALTLKGINLSSASWVIVSIKPDNGSVIEFNQDEMSISSTDNVTTIEVELSEAKSVALAGTNAIVDCNWMLNGYRGGAKPAMLHIEPTLLTRVVGNNAGESGGGG